MKTVTVGGRRYRVAARQYEAGVLDISGPGLVGGRAVRGTLDMPGLRDVVTVAVRHAQECRREAGLLSKD